MDEKQSIDEMEDELEPVGHEREEKGIEQQLFSWEGWDQSDTASFMFYKVKLRVPLGEHPVGAEFDSAYVSFDTSEMALYVADGPMVNGHGHIKEVFRGRLSLVVTPIPVEPA